MLKSLRNRAGQALAPRATSLAPGPTARLLHRALAQAIAGVGPLDGAAAHATKALEEAGGSREDAVDAIVSTHLKLAATQGFLSNLGGVVTLAATVPANIAALALLQCRMVAAIAQVEGHDLADPGVRNAVLATLLGEDAVRSQVKKGGLPGTPGQLARGDAGRPQATTPVPASETADDPDDPDDPAPAAPGATELDRVVATQVASSLIAAVIGKRAAVTVGKRVPLVGGVVGAGSDLWATRKVAAYARKELHRA